MSSRGRLLVLWNQTEEDIYERWREAGPQPLAWSPERLAPDVGTVKEEMDALIEALREGGFDVEVVNAEDDLDRVLGAIRLHEPDAIFNLVEYFNDDATHEAYIAGLYELMGVAYTGSRPRCLSTCMDKHRTKLILTAAGLPTARFFRCDSAEVKADHGLRFPLIVKPSQEDASGGIEPESVVWDQEALERRVAHVVKEFEQPVLVEEYIEGREIHAAILGNDPPEVLPLFEMEFDDTEFNPEGEWRPQIISFRAKWDPHSKAFYSMDARVPPEDLDDELRERIEDVALRAFKAMECRDYARIDMRVDDDGQIFILEVNPNPDLVDGTAYMQCATASGRTFSESLSEIADMAIARGRRHHAPAPEAEPAAIEAHAKPLPSDQLLREHILREQAAVRAISACFYFPPELADEPAPELSFEPVASMREAAAPLRERAVTAEVEGEAAAAAEAEAALAGEPVAPDAERDEAEAALAGGEAEVEAELSAQEEAEAQEKARARRSRPRPHKPKGAPKERAKKEHVAARTSRPRKPTPKPQARNGAKKSVTWPEPEPPSRTR